MHPRQGIDDYYAHWLLQFLNYKMVIKEKDINRQFSKKKSAFSTQLSTQKSQSNIQKYGNLNYILSVT